MQHALTVARTAPARQPLVSFTSGIVWLAPAEVSADELLALDERLGGELSDLAEADMGPSDDSGMRSEMGVEDLRLGLRLWLAREGDQVVDLVDYSGEHAKGWR